MREEEVQDGTQDQTVGQASVALKHEDYGDLRAVDIQKQVHQGSSSQKSWDEEIFDAVERGKQQYSGDFYVVVLLRKERLLDNVIRQMFVTRKSCPTPQYDQTVFRFRERQGDLEFIWTIPDKDTAVMLWQNRRQLSFEEHELLSYVDDFAEGKLDMKARELNGEMVFS